QRTDEALQRKRQRDREHREQQEDAEEIRPGRYVDRPDVERVHRATSSLSTSATAPSSTVRNDRKAAFGSRCGESKAAASARHRSADAVRTAARSSLTSRPTSARSA